MSKWRKGSPFAKHDAAKIGAELKSIQGDLTPSAVIEKASDENTELYKCFDWNNRIAADKWRLWQARELLGSLVITVETRDARDRKVEIEIKEYENVFDKKGGRRYVSTGQALNDKAMREQVLERLRDDISIAMETTRKYEMMIKSGKTVLKHLERAQAAVK